MSAVRKAQPMSIPEYLAGELVSPVKHEYVAGNVYAMSGATFVHNDIAGNIFAALKTRLRGRECRPYNSDTKVRMELDGETYFYYPDVSVICEAHHPTETYSDRPTVIVEVLSESTRRIDEGEKKKAYLGNLAVTIYALVETKSSQVVLYRRGEMEFARETYEGMNAVLPLPEIGAELPLSEVYENVDFSVAAAE